MLLLLFVLLLYFIVIKYVEPIAEYLAHLFYENKFQNELLQKDLPIAVSSENLPYRIQSSTAVATNSSDEMNRQKQQAWYL